MVEAVQVLRSPAGVNLAALDGQLVDVTDGDNPTRTGERASRGGLPGRPEAYRAAPA